MTFDKYTTWVFTTTIMGRIVAVASNSPCLNCVSLSCSCLRHPQVFSSLQIPVWGILYWCNHTVCRPLRFTSYVWLHTALLPHDNPFPFIENVLFYGRSTHCEHIHLFKTTWAHSGSGNYEETQFFYTNRLTRKEGWCSGENHITFQFMWH